MREKVYKRTVRRPLHSCVHVLASTSTCNHIMYRRSSGQLQRRFTLEVSCKLIDKMSLNYFRASLDVFPRNANLLAPWIIYILGEENFRYLIFALCVHWQIKQTFIKKTSFNKKRMLKVRNIIISLFILVHCVQNFVYLNCERFDIARIFCSLNSLIVMLWGRGKGSY